MRSLPNSFLSMVYFSMGFLSIGILSMVAFAASAQEPQFSEVVFDAGYRVDQSILAANLTGTDEQHIVLAGHDNARQQRLTIFQLDGESGVIPLVSLDPAPNVITYDIGRVGNQDSLFAIEPGRVMRYDFDNGEFVEVLKIQSLYSQERSGDLAPIDFIRDINNDKRDDLVLPDAAGYRVRLQMPEGHLGPESLLQESVSMALSEGSVYFENRPLASGDVNLDGLVDLAVWSGNAVRVYLQLPGFRFESNPEIVELGLGLMSEAVLRALNDESGAVDQSGLEAREIWSIADLNDDQLPDIITETTLSSGVFDKQTELRLHLGFVDGGHLAYNDAEDSLLQSDGLQYGLVSTDINGDGKMDLIARKVRLSFGRFIRAMLSGGMALEIQFFQMSENDEYPEDANYSTKTKVRFSLSSGQVDIPAVEVADFDGDGFKDLMLQTKPERLSFHYGISGPGLFNKKSAYKQVVLPRNGELVSAEDINNDGKADLIMRYNESDADDLVNTVRLLLSGD
jgi:hypothetical protein